MSFRVKPPKANFEIIFNPRRKLKGKSPTKSEYRKMMNDAMKKPSKSKSKAKTRSRYA